VGRDLNVRECAGGLAPAGGGKVEGTVGVPERAVREVRSGVSPLAGPSVECFFPSLCEHREVYYRFIRGDIKRPGGCTRTRCAEQNTHSGLSRKRVMVDNSSSSKAQVVSSVLLAQSPVECIDKLL